ncbi:MAG: hypothetical protein ABIF71_06165 [Planctomycetota bacterium]
MTYLVLYIPASLLFQQTMRQSQTRPVRQAAVIGVNYVAGALLLAAMLAAGDLRPWSTA